MAYQIRLRPGVTVGLGVSLDTQNLSEAAHKVCIYHISRGNKPTEGIRSAQASHLKDRYAGNLDCSVGGDYVSLEDREIVVVLLIVTFFNLPDSLD